MKNSIDVDRTHGNFITLTMPIKTRVLLTFLVVLGCGGTANQNCTYFQSSSTIQSGACSIKICKCNSDICQVCFMFLFYIAECNWNSDICQVFVMFFTLHNANEILIFIKYFSCFYFTLQNAIEILIFVKYLSCFLHCIMQMKF